MMPQTQNTEPAADLPDLAKLESDLQGHLWDQNQEDREVERIRAAMKQRQKLITSLSDQVDQARAGLDTDAGASRL